MMSSELINTLYIIINTAVGQCHIHQWLCVHVSKWRQTLCMAITTHHQLSQCSIWQFWAADATGVSVRVKTGRDVIIGWVTSAALRSTQWHFQHETITITVLSLNQSKLHWNCIYCCCSSTVILKEFTVKTRMDMTEVVNI